MCDYSLMHVQSRPASVGDKLITRDFGTGTRGFAAPENRSVAVCVMPGTEIAFTEPVMVTAPKFLGFGIKKLEHRTAIFRQVNKDAPAAHHDALEFPDGRTVLLTNVCEGQEATVLQLPAQPETLEEKEEQRRVEYVG
ncbi:MAG TPA: hypothetical protein VNR11_11945 [Xanthobacteraceae bacterium]|nr:hypothetical protein [Xanthobacteraceae bacterium]